MKDCIHCGHAVSLGDRHSKLNCPPPALGASSNRRRRKLLARKRNRREAAFIPQRGQAVTGTGKPKGASK